jgi:hypothetical protein
MPGGSLTMGAAEPPEGGQGYWLAGDPEQSRAGQFENIRLHLDGAGNGSIEIVDLKP